jgi:hypothetical protein
MSAMPTAGLLPRRDCWRRTSGMRHMVAIAIGSSVAKIGPICSWTSFASTNWLAQIKLQRMSNDQSTSRAAVRALIADARKRLPSAAAEARPNAFAWFSS